MTLDIFQEQPDIHKQIEIIGILDLIILLGIHHKNLILRILSRQNVHLSIIERRLDDMQLEGRQR